jgi:dihydroorotate dehydrogenase electron transfer subunit
MELQRSRILENRKFPDGFFLLRVENFCCGTLEPGQFFQIRVAENFEPFLLRPFSIFHADTESLWFLVAIVGKGTEILANKKSGEQVQILGPLGKGFPVFEDVTLVAGGSGIAPLYFYAKRYGYKRFVWGLRTLPSRDLLDVFNGLDIVIVTEDGSSGFAGVATQYIDAASDKKVFACGPVPMLNSLKEVHGIDCWVSVESAMACGFGICFGCAVKKASSEGYFRVCTEGPVFKLEDLDFQIN